MLLPTRLASGLSLALVLLVAAPSAAAQSWEYRSYKKNDAGQYEKGKFVTGTISIEQKDGQWWFRHSAGRSGRCYEPLLPASVTKTDATTTIEVTQPVPGCDEFRYVIRNDGSGGYKETKAGERWVRSRFDHGLTPAK
jgi:hypothetical protein